MNKSLKNKLKIINSVHLRNIFENDYYLELGIIDVEVIKRLLNYEIININEISFLPIQNKGIGHSRSESEEIRDNLPYYFFRKFQDNNPLMHLVITYGLCYYRDFEKKDKFAPIIFIPITMYYEKDVTYVKMTSKPFENPALYNIFKKVNRLQFIQNENFHDIYSLDNVIFNFERINKGCTRLDNYLTFVERKKEDIIIYSKRKFDEDYFEQNSLFQRDIYYSQVLTKEQKSVVDRAVNGNDITFTGFIGTGKTTVLKNIIVNALYQKQKVLYLSNSRESINDVKEFLDEHDLANCYIDLCRIRQENKTINKQYTEYKEDEINALEKELKEKLEIVNKFEKEMNKMTADFKLVEAIKKLFLVKNYERMDDFEFKDIDSLDYLYKNEYINIYKALEQIEQNSQKINSFKDSVWKQIPYINNIKYVNQVINIVFQLNTGLKSLKEKVHLLEEFGVKKITSFSGVKRELDPIEKMNISSIPNKWIEDFGIFKNAKEKYFDLEKEIVNYQNLEYDLSTKYINLNSINIDDEISHLYEDVFQKNEGEKIDNIISNIYEYEKEASNVSNLLKGFKNTIDEVSKLLDWEYFDKDISINDINILAKLYLTYPISGKLLAMIMNNKDGKTLSRLEEIDESISSIQDEINQAFQSNPRLNKLIKNNPQSQAVINYNQLVKKMNKLEKEYFEICDINYHNHKEVIETIRELKKYYTAINTHSNRKKIIDYILSINKNNRKDDESKFKQYNSLYDVINDEIKSFKKIGFDFDDKSIVTRIEQLEKYANYIHNLYESQERLLKTKVSTSKNYILVEEYYTIKNIIDNFDKTVNNLRQNDEFKYLYEFLYQGEQTDFKNISKVIKGFEQFVNTFETVDSAMNTLRRFSEIRELADGMNTLVDSIGGNLRLYSLIFKDSVSRYYFSNIEQNIEYLDSLLEAKEELVLYLNITKGLAVLNEYHLDKLIEYIVSKDKVYDLTNFFTYKYFKGLIRKDIANSKNMLTSAEYFKCLEEIVDLEDKICKMIGDNIIYKIHQSTPYNIKSHRHSLIRAKVIFSTMGFAEEVIRKNQYDILLVDDAHLINEGKLENLFKDNQMIVCGDYQSNKVVNQNLISFVTNKNTDIFRSRLVQGPRKLTYNMSMTKSPFLNTYEANRGIKVVKENIEEVIYNFYVNDKNVKINYYIKNPDEQFEEYERISEYFYGRKVSPQEIIRFINGCVNIVELEKSNYIHSDYDIINFSDYYKENSQIMSNNYLEKLMISQKGLIILDEKGLLESDINYCFYNRIKDLYENGRVFLGETGDEMSNKIAAILQEKGYEVYFPSNGINLTVKKKNSDELVSIVILFSNGFVSNVSSNYRFLKNVYIEKGHKMIIRTMLDLINGPQYFVDKLCEEIDG